MPIDIDDNTFLKIFPCLHVEFLDRLKGHKRRTEDQKRKQTIQKKKKNSNMKALNATAAFLRMLWHPKSIAPQSIVGEESKAT